MRIPVILALALAVLVLAIACNDDGDTPPDLVAPVAIHDGTWNYDDALLSGSLVEEDGCLVILVGGQRILPAFPDDEVIWDPPTHVLTVKGVEFRPGQEAAFGGSGGDGRDLPADITWVNAPPDTCRYDSIWFAGQPSSPPTSFRTPPPSGDAAIYASEHGVTLEEAERRIALQLQSHETSARLQQAHRDRLASVWLEHTGEFRLVAWYTGDEHGLDEARAIAADAPLPVEIRTGATQTQAELLAAMDRLRPRAQQLFYLIGIGVYPQTGSVGLTIENRGPNASRAAELATELTAEFGVPVTIEVDD